MKEIQPHWVNVLFFVLKNCLYLLSKGCSAWKALVFPEYPFFCNYSERRRQVFLWQFLYVSTCFRSDRKLQWKVSFWLFLVTRAGLFFHVFHVRVRSAQNWNYHLREVSISKCKLWYFLIIFVILHCFFGFAWWFAKAKGKQWNFPVVG